MWALLPVVIDVVANILDQSNPGLFVCNTVNQEGNAPVVLSNPIFDEESNVLSVSYADADGNLPWFKSAQLCNTPSNGGNCFTQISMIPDSHDYEEGVLFSATITDDIINQFNLSGDYEAHFWFADDDIDEYPVAQIELDINVGGGCGLVGDVNEDAEINVLDVVLLVNIVLEPNQDGNACSDVNGDGFYDILDVVLLVNIVLGSS